RFLAGDDVVLDREFFLHDIQASTAHAEGLQRIGILSEEELAGLRRELVALASDFRTGNFVLDERFEDGHSAIEARLTERLGDAGRKIHTGRSRNDQVLVATRLWLKEKLARVAGLSSETAKIALDRAEAERAVPLPGYTHIQRAVVSSAGKWWAGWAEAFIDNAIRAADTLALVDSYPLGTAAGYGVNLPLDREHTTQALGFARMQVSQVYAQLSRGKFELAAHEALGGSTATTPPGRRASGAVRGVRSMRSSRAAASSWPCSRRSTARRSACTASPGTCRCSPAPSSVTSRCRRSTPPAARSCPTTA